MKTFVIPAKAGIYLDRFRIKSGTTIVLLAVFSLSFFWPVWLQGRLPIPADALVGLYHPFRNYFSDKFPQGAPYKNFILTDPVLQQYPWKWLAVNQLENPYSFGGWAANSVENIQAGAFYPLNILFFLISDFSMAWTIFIIIQPILASLFMFWWLKNSGIKQIAALFGGLVWAFSSFNLVWLEWGNIGHAGLWLPLALLAVDKVAERKKEEGRRKKAIWHGVLQFSLVASLLAGHWQITLYLLLSVFVYVLFFKRFNLAAARLNLNKISLFFAHCSLLIVLTAPQWLPAWRFMAVSNRGVEQENALSREGFFISPKHLIQLAVPDFFGNPATGNYRGEWNYAEQVIYIGLIPLIFSILVVVNLVIPGLTRNLFRYLYRSRIKSGMTGGKIEIFAVSIIFLGLLFAVRNPIAEIPYKLNIPVWSDLQPTRLSYLIIFGLSVLAAVGMEGLIRRSDSVRNDRNVMVIIGGLGIVFLTLLIYSSKLNAADRVVSQRNLIFPMLILGLFGVFAVTVGIFRRLPRSPSQTWLLRNDSVILFSIFYFLFSIFDLFRFGWKFTPFSPPEYLYPVTPAIKFLQENMEPGDKYMTLDRRILPPNANIMYKLESIEGYDPIYSRDYALLITEMETGRAQNSPANFGRIVRPMNFRSPIAKELGVKYVLALGEIEDEKLTKVFQEGETRIYKLVK